jgi:hypothetical protein
MAVGGGVRLGRITALCLVLAVAGVCGVFGPRLLGDAAARARSLAAMKRKAEALHDFALFRSKGDKAVLRWGETPPHTPAHGDQAAPHHARRALPTSDN